MKATETAVDIVQKFPTGTSAVKFLVKLLPANMEFVNYSGRKFFPDFKNTQKQALLMFCEKKVFLKISRISQDNNSVGVYF